MPDPEIDDPILGRLRRNNRYGFYEGTFQSGDSFKISLHPDEAGDVTPTLNRARQVCSDFARVAKEAEDYLVADLLEVKNDGWLDDDEEPLTPEQFRARLELSWVEFSPEGIVSFYYDCDEMFTDHCLSATMDESGEFISAGVEG